MKLLDELFDWLNELKITWWPFPLPPRDQPLSVFFWLQCGLFHTFLPWIISVSALMGGIYFPSFFLVNEIPHGLLPAFLLGGFWAGLHLLLRLPNFLFWNRRANRLAREMGKTGPQKPFVQFGLPPILSRSGQQPKASFMPSSPLNYHAWKPFGEAAPIITAKPILSALFYGTSLAALILFVCFVSASTLLYTVTRDLQTLTPALTSVPQAMQVNAKPNPMAKRLCCIGYEEKATAHSPVKSFSFELPWDEVRVGELEDFVSVCSRQGKCLFFEKAHKNNRGLIQLKTMVSKLRFQQIRYRTPHAKATLDMDYFDKTLQATPASLSPFTPPWQAFPAFGTLLNKLYLLGGTDHLYRFDTGNFKGFQLGNPEHDKWVQLLVFDTRHHWFSLNVGTQERSKTHVKQSEINLILKSLALSDQEATAHVQISPSLMTAEEEKSNSITTTDIQESQLGTTYNQVP